MQQWRSGITLPSPYEDPRIIRSREIIRQAALEHFFTDGFSGTSVEAVANTAGVAKRTVYNIYESKENLFREVLQEAISTAERFSEQRITDLTSSIRTGGNIAADLEELGVALALTVLGNNRVIRLRRLIIGEAERYPDLAAEYYERAPGRVMSTLADQFAGLADRGDLSIDDPEVAAAHFAFLVMGAPLDRALFEGSDGDIDTADIEQGARAGVTVFLRAYTG